MITNDDWKTYGLAWVKVDNKLTIVLPTGETKTISSDQKNYGDVLEAIKANNWEDIPDLMCPKNLIKSFSSGTFEVVDDSVVINGEVLPSVLSNKILEFAEEELPYEPLVKFWNNLKENPSYRAVQQLYGFLLQNNHPITSLGNFIAYKAVRRDFTDKYTGTISNKVGETVVMPRNNVNENPEQTCSNGLHAANYEYASKIYGSSGDVMLMLEINPKNVVAIPIDYNNAKMRVCEYKVLSVVDHEYKESSLYINGSLDSPDDYKVLDEDDDYEDEEEYEDDDYEKDEDY